MKGKILDIASVRCNFCFNWISGQSLVKKGFNSCIPCIQRYQGTTFQVYTPENTIYQLLLKETINRLDQVFQQCRSIHQEEGQEIYSEKRKRKKLPSIVQVETQQSDDESIFDPKLSSIKNSGNEKVQHVMDFVRAFNLDPSKSLLINREIYSKNKPHQSLIFNTPDKEKDVTDFLSLKKIGQLQDYGRSLDRTRFLDRYQFYYDNNTIQQFVEEHPKIQERQQFGRQILSNEFSQSRIGRSRMTKSRRSKFSNDSQFKSQKKLTEEEVKTKISGFLESKYQSESLTRIIASYLKESYQNTNIYNKTLELTKFKLQSIDLKDYLNMFDFEGINIIKMINVGLTDEQLPILINHISSLPIQSLVLTGNKLTQNCLGVFLNNSLPFLKELYLGNNRISKGKLKQNITQLHRKFILYL